MQMFMQNVVIKDPLNPRNDLYGRRTNATRLYCLEKDMRYVIVCSLYPCVLKYILFPTEHPEIITQNFGDVNSYFGLIHCRISLSRSLYHPVLPYRTWGKLLFPLCPTCAEDNLKKHACTYQDSWSLEAIHVNIMKNCILSVLKEILISIKYFSFIRFENTFVIVVMQNWS